MPTEVENAARRVLESIALMFNEAKADALRGAALTYLQALFEQGQKDEERLAVAAMSYLRGQAATQRPRVRRPSL